MIIKKLVVFPLVMHLDGADSTGAAKATLQAILEWGKREFDLNYSSDSITRWAYVSDLVFETDFPLLLNLNNAMNSLSAKITSIVRNNLKEDLEYVPAKFWLAHDPSRRNASVAPFTIEHRALTLFEQNVYYSEAPVPTEDHISLLNEFEEAARKVYEGR